MESIPINTPVTSDDGGANKYANCTNYYDLPFNGFSQFASLLLHLNCDVCVCTRTPYLSLNND